MPRVNGKIPGSSSIDTGSARGYNERAFPRSNPFICLTLALEALPPYLIGRTFGVCLRFPSSGGGEEVSMDDVMNRMAKELSDAIAAAVAADARVEACREKARAAGFEMKVSLEAVIGFVTRTQPGSLARVAPQQKALAKQEQRRAYEISANDKRFLRSLRIAAEETQEKEVE